MQILQEMNEKDKQELQTALLKEALAISNEKSNKLLEQQNRLIEEMRSDIAGIEYSLRKETEKAVREIKAERDKTEKLNESIVIKVEKAVGSSANDLKAELWSSVEEALKGGKEEMEKTKREIEKQRKEMHIEGGFRKFFFWATPILLLAQTIAIIFLILIRGNIIEGNVKEEKE